MNKFLCLIYGLIFTCIGTGMLLIQFSGVSINGIWFFGLGFILLIIGVLLK